MKVLVKEPNEDMNIISIKDDLESYQKIVGGYIESVFTSDEIELNGICCYGNEEAKILGLEPNFWLYDKLDLFSGTAVFFNENGNDLTDYQIKIISDFLEENKYE